MPIASQRIPMSDEAWRLLPYQPGWKYEYLDGCARITPSHQVAVTQVAVTPRPVVIPCELRPVLSSDETDLLDIYMAAFDDNQAFCDYTAAQFREAARQDLYESFHGRRGPLLPASRVALSPQANHKTPMLIGAALLSRDAEYGPVLDLVFVLPSWHHRGVATALVSEAGNALAEDGDTLLTSCYQLANVTSQQWHQTFGFKELPDLRYAQVYRRQARQKLYRCEQSGDTASEVHARLTREVAYWQAQVEMLQRMDDEQGFWAVYPRIPHW